MGDVVEITVARRTRRPTRRAAEADGPATVVLFTGVRIERWDDRAPPAGDRPGSRPSSRRRRRPS
jgi:hypothetical protein